MSPFRYAREEKVKVYFGVAGQSRWRLVAGKVVSRFREKGYPMYVVRVEQGVAHVDDCGYDFVVRSEVTLRRRK